MEKLLPLEKDVMTKLLKGDHSVLSHLREQFSKSDVKDRWNSGVVFFVEFAVEETISIDGKPNFTLGDVEATISELQNGAGFVLFIRQGRLDTLEGYTVDDHWPDQIVGFHLHYVKDNQPSEERDVKALQKAINNASQSDRE